MKKAILYLILLNTISCAEHHNKLVKPANGISHELAEFRKKQVSDVVYNLTFSIPLDLKDSIPSELNLDLSIHDLSQSLFLDFNQNRKWPLSIVVNEKAIPLLSEHEHLEIPAKYLTTGKNSINIKFVAGELSLNRNTDYLYTLLVPARASTLFPCFDQPDIKASYILNITAPKQWKVLCGAPLDYQKKQGSFTQHQFKATDKMSTYLFSFVTGKFEIIDNESEDLPMKMLYRETDKTKISHSVPVIFDLHKLSLDYLEGYTGYQFPFQKLDLVSIPGFQYGGMEHIGAIQYRESSLFLDSSATLSQELNRAKLIAHETSHMWFGNLVTMKWFDDVWLKEVFANLMADKIINPAFPKVDHQLQFVTGHYPAAYTIDRSSGANPIRQDLNNLNNAGSLYGNIIYHKAPIMMRQLEATLGEINFQKGMAEYIKKYANDNADWNDLIEILDNKTKIDLKQWSEVWVNSPGRPIVTSRIEYDTDNKIASFEIAQKAEDGTGKIWPQLFEVTLLYPDSTTTIAINSSKNNTEIVAAKGLPKPHSILYNSNGFGYGVFPVEKGGLDAIADIDDKVARGYSYINCYENTLNGAVPAKQSFQLLLQGLRSESNELILRLITRELSSIYWHYLTEAQRGQSLPHLQELLYNRLQADESSNIKKDLFNLFKSMAYTGNDLEQLYHIWSKDQVIPNLILNENDYTEIAMYLALYQHKETTSILESARESISNPDRLRRFEFLLPSLSHDERVRAQNFESFKEQDNREKENWVLSACYFIHHPLRQKQAINSLRMSLDILEEIQQTGDIFFPKGWLDNTIGLYSSKEALKILEEFIETHPDLNPQLRLKLLQSTDDLRRFQELLQTQT